MLRKTVVPVIVLTCLGFVGLLGEERVREAQDARRELQTEQMELRKLKGELTQLLTQLRDNQTQMQRSAITEGTKTSPQRAIEDRPDRAAADKAAADREKR